MVRGNRREQSYAGRRVPERQQRLDPRLEHGDVQLDQPGRLGPQRRRLALGIRLPRQSSAARVASTSRSWGVGRRGPARPAPRRPRRQRHPTPPGGGSRRGSSRSATAPSEWDRAATGAGRPRPAPRPVRRRLPRSPRRSGRPAPDGRARQRAARAAPARGDGSRERRPTPTSPSTRYTSVSLQRPDEVLGSQPLASQVGGHALVRRDLRRCREIARLASLEMGAVSMTTSISSSGVPSFPRAR